MTAPVNIALYYPDIFPPINWIRRTLLLYDAIASVADDAFFDRATPDVQWLFEQGAMVPLRCDSLRGHTLRAAEEELILRLAMLPDEDSGAIPVTLRYGKIPDQIIARLERKGLVRLRSDVMLAKFPHRTYPLRRLGPLPCHRSNSSRLL